MFKKCTCSVPVLLCTVLYAVAGSQFHATAQTTSFGTVKGTVNDRQTRQPLPGATILLIPREDAPTNDYVYAYQDSRATLGTVVGEATQKQRYGAVVGKNGEFIIKNVRPGLYTLTARYIGYKRFALAVTVEADNVLSTAIEAIPDVQGVDAVVVTGLVSRTQRSVAEVAVGRVDAEQITSGIKYTEPSQLLIGKIPGIVVAASSGVVGSGQRITIRSNAGYLGGQPVIFVDGVRVVSLDYFRFITPPIDEISPLFDIVPDDIETIEVLKGPSSAALYGTQAQNGVVLITTKHGRNRRTVDEPFQFNYQYARGFQQPSRTYTKDMALTYKSANDVFRYAAPMETHFVNMQGATSIVSYYASVEHRNESGIIPGNELSRTAVRLNMELTPSEYLTARLQASFISTNLATPLADLNGGWTYGWLSNALQGSADPNGRRFFRSDSLAIASIENSIRMDHFIGSADITYIVPFVEGLRLRGLVGVEATGSRGLTYLPPGLNYTGPNSRDVGSRYFRDGLSQRLNTDFSASYSREWLPDLTTNVTLGAQTFDNLLGLNQLSATNLLSPLLPAIQNGVNNSTFQGNTVSEIRDNFRTAGIFGRVESNFRQTYFFSFGARNDYASSLSSAAPSILYPQVSGAVRVDRLGFLPDEFNLFKLRAAYGETGRLPAYNDVRKTWRVGFGPGSSLTGNPGTQLFLLGLGSDTLRPERIREIEVGIEAEFMNRYGVEFTYFIQNSNDAIFNNDVFAPLGTPGAARNVGRIRGWGYEAQVYGSIMRTNDVDVRVNGILNYSNNVIESTDIASEIGYGSPIRANYIKVGLPRGSFMSFPPIQPRFRADGYYDWVQGPVFSDTLTYIGSTVPLYTGSLSASVELFRTLKLTTLVDFGFGRNMLNLTRWASVQTGNDKRFNELATQLGVANTQTASNEDLKIIPVMPGIQPLTPGTPAYEAAAREFMRLDWRFGVTSNFNERSDWVRLREISLRWSAIEFLKSAVPVLGSAMRECAIGISVRNAALWTNYSGIDTEINSPGTSSSTDQAQSTDRWVVMQARAFAFMLTIGL
jgi:TonB-dependent starch-binding outer membrane protein SusC